MKFKLINSKNISAFLAILYLLFVKFPGRYIAITSGLDASWQYGLNYLNQTRALLTQDVPTFNYGPLGYLLVPLNVGSNLVHAMVFCLLIHCFLIAILCYYVLSKRQPLRVVLFVACYTIAPLFGFGLSDEYENTFLIITCLLLFIAAEDNRAGIVAAIINAILAGVFLFIKFSLGLPAIAMSVCLLLIRIIRRRPKAKRLLLVTTSAYLLTVFIIAVFYFGSFHNFTVWLATSWHIADGYSVVMSLVGPASYVRWAGLGLAVYAALTLLLYKAKSPLLDVVLALSIGVFFNFKHSVVRQDAHLLFLFPFLLVVVGLIMLNTTTAKELKLGIVSFLLLLVLALPAAIHYDRLTYDLMLNECLGLRGRENIVSLLKLNSVRRRLNLEGRNNLAAQRLPDEWTALIKAAGGTVDVLPWEITYCPANDLKWNPNPVLQSYNAYKASLDRRVAAHYRGAHAPTFILLEFGDIDGRNPLLTAPATWRAILQNYDVIRIQDAQGLHLLRKRLQPQVQSLSLLKQEQAQVRQWVSVPASDKMLYAYINMPMSLIGRLDKSLYQIPPVNIVLLYASGRTMTHRIVPDTASDGLLLNYLPLNMEELNNLFSHTAIDKITKFRITGPGAVFFRRTFAIQWKEDQGYALTSAPADEARLAGLTPLAQATRFAVEVINGHAVPSATPIVVDAASEDLIRISGWAVDERAQDAAGAVFLSIDNQTDVRAADHQDRADVAKYFNNQRYKSSGFSLAIPTATLGKGRHTLSIKILTNGKDAYYQPPLIAPFEVR